MVVKTVEALAVVVTPTTTVGVAVTQVVSGVPTVTEKVRCDETWVPDRIIFQFPDFMAEKGMPQVDVTCTPACSVLMAEHAYWLLSGPMRTGLIDS